MRVLVTRPEPGASRTAEKLVRMGHESLVMSLSQTSRLEAGAPTETFDAVAVTSANAVRYAKHSTIEAVIRLPCFVVGAKTAEAARHAGFGDIRAAEGDADMLAELIQREIPIGGRLLYICGRIRRPALEHHLVAHGYAIRPLETYDTVAQRLPEAAIAAILGSKPVDVALVYSVLGGEALRDLLELPRWQEHFSRTRLLCLSKRIAEAWKATGRSVLVADGPDEDALLSLLAAG